MLQEKALSHTSVRLAKSAYPLQRWLLDFACAKQKDTGKKDWNSDQDSSV